MLTECLFSDGNTPLAASYQQVSNNFGLTVNSPKAKHMVTDRSVEEADQEQVILEDKVVNEFQYLDH